MKKLIQALSFTLLILALAGCSSGVDQASGPPRVALVLKTLNHPFFIDMKAGAEEAAARLGIELIVQAAERELDVEKQMQIVENLLQTQIDVLCLTPSGSRELIPAIEKANQAGIPVVTIDTRVDTSSAPGLAIETFVGSDNYQGGHLVGEYIAEKLGHAKVAILEGIPGHETGDARLRGFRDAVEEVEGIEIVASQPANWERDQGFTVFQNMLQAHPDIDTLFACSDLMALGAMEAIAAAGQEDRIRVVGFDALDEARQAIEQGRMLASIAQFPGEMGKIAIESAYRLLQGHTLAETLPVKIELVTKGEGGQ